MKFILNLILIYCLIISQAFGQATNPNDVLKLGDKSSSSDKGITFETGDGVSNKKLLVEKISKKLKWNGNSVQIGDGSSSSDKEIVIAGALKSLKYNGTSGEFEFDDDVKLVGSLKTDILQAINSEISVKNALRAEIGVKFGTGNAEIKYDTGLNSLVFSNDGTLYKKVGSGSGSGDGGVSILKNGSFEDGSMNWTNVGGTYVTESYTNGTESDLKYAKFTTTSASQTLCSDLATTPSYFGDGGMIDFTYTGTGTAFLAYVVDGSGNKLTAPQLLQNQTAWTKLSPIPFSFNTSQKLCFESSSAGEIKIDKAYLGSNKGIGTLTSFKDGIVRFNSSTALLTTSGHLGFPLSGFTYEKMANDLFDIQNVSNVTRFYAKKKISVPNVYVSGYAVSGSLQYSIYKNGTYVINGTQNNSAGYNSIIAAPILLEKDDYITIYSNSAMLAQNILVSIYAQEVTQDQVQTPEASQWFIDANIGGNDAFASVSTSYKPFENGSLDMWINNGSSPVKIACANSYATGLTCSSNEQIGVVFTNPYAGYFEACFSATFDNPNGYTMGVQAVETPVNSDTVIQEGKSRIMFTNNNGGTINAIGSKVCGTFYFSEAKERAIKLAHESDSATNRVRASRQSSFGQEDIHITVRPLLQNSLRAILTGDQVRSVGTESPDIFSVTYGANGGSVYSPCLASSTCSIEQFGNAVASISQASAGVMTLTTTRQYSKLRCTGSLWTTGSGGVTPLFNQQPVGYNMVFDVRNSSGTPSISTGTISCIGQK